MVVVSRRFITNSSINHPLCICMMDDFFILSKKNIVVAYITNYRQINPIELREEIKGRLENSLIKYNQ